MNTTITADLFPDADWDHVDPADCGLDGERLDNAADAIFEIDKRYGVLVAKGGRIAYERYRRDAAATNPVFSVTKGLGATLIGIAQQQGILRTEDYVRDWLPVRHPDIAEDAQIKHLLNMTASRTPAGSWWQYNSAEILNSLTGILWLASGMPPVEFYNRYLRRPVGFSFEWPSNPKGWIQIGSQGPLPVIEATHRDIARMGLLWLRGGKWNGEQLMSPQFVAEALSPAYPKANGAYGYLWWLNSPEGTYRTTGGRAGEGKWFPKAPDNMFMALGARGKVMVILPDEDLILVTMGDTPQEQSANYLGTIVENTLSLV